MEGLLGVAHHDLVQPALRAPFRHADADLGAAPLPQPCLEDLTVGRLGGHEHPWRHLLALHVELAHERRDQLLARELLDAVDDPPLAAEHPAPSHHEHLKRGLEIVVGHADHVDALGAIEHHLLGFEGAPRGAELVAELRRLLVLLALGRLVHLAVETLHHRLRVAGEEVGERVDVGAVGLVRDPAHLGHARPAAPTDVEVEARSLRARTLVEEGVGARAHREDAGQRVERVADRPRVPVRPEVADLLPLRAAEHLGARPLLPHGEREVRVALVVAVADVEPRPVALDQVVLEHQGVDLAARDDPLDALGVLHHRLGARVQGLAPVVGESLAERPGLADVDHPAVAVAEQVGARFVGDVAGGRSGEGHPVIVVVPPDTAGERGASCRRLHRRPPRSTARAPVIVVGWTSQTKKYSPASRADRRRGSAAIGPGSTAVCADHVAAFVGEQVDVVGDVRRPGCRC